MIIGLLSTYREGHLLDAAVRSARVGCDHVMVFEGPVDGSPAPPEQAPRWWHYGTWGSDAAKRTAMLRWAKAKHLEANSAQRKEPLWVVWIDGDEVLVWGEYLRDWTHRAEMIAKAGGMPLRLVELDGSVAMCHGKVVNANVISEYLHSSFQVKLTNGMVVALPNVKICGAGGLPVGPAEGWQALGEEERDGILAVNRPPLAGEPHLLHRSLLRDPERGVGRLHKAEAEWFTKGADNV